MVDSHRPSGGLPRWCGTAMGLRPWLVRTVRVALVAAALPAAWAADPEPAPLVARTIEPRAFGYRTGDVLERQVIVDIPSRLKLVEDSLPTVGPQGPVLELRSLRRSSQSTSTGQRLTLNLRYQVFAAPVAVRTYELPKLSLRFDGVPRGEDLRIDPWPVVVAALATEEVSAREGLGELRPDMAPPLRETGFERGVLLGCAAMALLLCAYLAFVYVGLPWRAQRHRPFTYAFRTVQARGDGDIDGDWREACRALHAAFNQTAGRTVFAEAIDGFVLQAPRFAGLQDDIRTFFNLSQAAFFADAQQPPPQRDWLVSFAKACRDAERGSA